MQMLCDKGFSTARLLRAERAARRSAAAATTVVPAPAVDDTRRSSRNHPPSPSSLYVIYVCECMCERQLILSAARQKDNH